MRGGNPHRPQTTRRTGPRQELTVGSRKRKFLVGRASTLLGKGSTWELGRRGHAATGRPPVARDNTHVLAVWGKVPGRRLPIRPQGEGESGTPRPTRRVCLRRSADASCDRGARLDFRDRDSLLMEAQSSGTPTAPTPFGMICGRERAESALDGERMHTETLSS